MEQTLLSTLAEQGSLVLILGIVLWFGLKLYTSQVERSATVSDREAAESRETTIGYIKHLETENGILLNHFLALLPSNGASVPLGGNPGSGIAQAAAGEQYIDELVEDAFPSSRPEAYIANKEGVPF